MAQSIIAGSQIVVENMLQKETIRLKQKKHVITQVANNKYKSGLVQMGDTVVVEQVPNMFGNVGGVAGDDIAISGWAIADFQLQITDVYQNGRSVKNIEEIQSNIGLEGSISERMAFASSNHEDQYTASFFTFAANENKINDLAPIALTATNVYAQAVSMTQVAEEQNAEADSLMFVNPQIRSQLRLADILDATEKGLTDRLNGETGAFDGHRTLLTNNLPHIRVLTLDTQPTAADTVVVNAAISQSTTGIGGFVQTAVTFTFVLNGTAAAVGEISIGATLADTQASLVEAINGTGTVGASNYIDVTAANRTGLKNGFVRLGAFNDTAGSVVEAATLQSANYMAAAPTTSLTGGANGMGADAVLWATVDGNAINTVFQEDVFKVEPAPLGFRINLLQEKAYGGNVLGENNKGITTNAILTGKA